MSSVSVLDRVASLRTLRLPPGQSDLRSCVDRFLIACQARRLSPRTVSFYAEKLARFCSHLEAQGIGAVEDVTPDHLRKWLLEEGEHRTPGGVAAFYRSARRLFCWYESEFEPEGWRDPFKRVPQPKVPEEILEPVPEDDLRAMINTCRGRRSFLDSRDKVLLICLYDTGCRASEFLRLNLDDIDRKTGDVLIRESKSGRPRHVFVSHAGWSALVPYFHFRRDAGDSDPLWVTRSGRRLEYAGLRSIVRRRALLAGVKQPALHAFRRGTGISLHRAGVDVLSIQRILGHRDLSTTKRYVKLEDSDLAKIHMAHAPGDRLLGAGGS